MKTHLNGIATPLKSAVSILENERWTLPFHRSIDGSIQLKTKRGQK